MPTGRPVPRQTAAHAAAMQQEVLTNIRNRSLGPATVADLSIPEPFLARVAARIIQKSYHEHFRVVVPDETGSTEGGDWKPQGPAAAVRTTHTPTPSGFPVTLDVPPSRGFMPAVLDGDIPVPFSPSGDPRLTSLIAKSLATDGLLLTAARAIDQCGAGSANAATMLQALSNAGFPIDLLRHFRPVGVESPTPLSIIEWLAAQPVAKRLPHLATVPFSFIPTSPDFRASPESGQLDPTGIRLQLSRGGYWLSPGDGGSIDILQQVLESFPDARVIAHIEQRHVPDLLSTIGAWPRQALDRIHLLTQNLPISQWAADSGKSGINSSGSAAILVPRFASRGEEAPLYDPGDTLLARALANSGVEVAHSPLLFQGGNLIIVEEADGQRTMLIGEAEVYRNRALGLSSHQTLAAFRAEFGVDRCVILPAASIHIDYEVSCRLVNGKVIALVADQAAGARTAVEAGLRALSSAGLIELSTSLTHLSRGQFFPLATLVWRAISGGDQVPRTIPLRTARHFSTGPSDSGVGNIRSFFTALDSLLSAGPHATADPNHAACLASHRLLADARSDLRKTLRSLGWAVTQVPTLAVGDHSCNALNGLHTPNTYFSPSIQGLFSDLDDRSDSATRRALGGGDTVRHIRTAESQRRDGALRCSTSLFEGAPDARGKV